MHSACRGVFRSVRTAHSIAVELGRGGLCIEQDSIVFAGEPLFRCIRPRIAPHDFIAEVVPPKDGVQHGLGVGVGRVVDVEVQAPRRLQDAVHLQDADTQVAQERAHVLARRRVRRLNDGVQVGMVVLDGLRPLALYIVAPRPRVLVGDLMARLAHTRRHSPLEGFDALVEGRVCGYQVHALGVDAPEDGKVVADEQGAVEVGRIRRVLRNAGGGGGGFLSRARRRAHACAFLRRFIAASVSYRHTVLGLACSTTSATRSGGASIGSGI